MSSPISSGHSSGLRGGARCDHARQGRLPMRGHPHAGEPSVRGSPNALQRTMNDLLCVEHGSSSRTSIGPTMHKCAQDDPFSGLSGQWVSSVERLGPLARSSILRCEDRMLKVPTGDPEQFPSRVQPLGSIPIVESKSRLSRKA